MGLIHCNLRVLMAERGLNIQKVKDQTSLSRTTISNLYNNLGSGIQYSTLLELCELLDCTPGDLLTYVEIENDFKVISENLDCDMIEDTHVEDEEGNGFSYISEIQMFLDVLCNLKYEGKNHELKFRVYVQYGINHKKELNRIDIALYQNLHEELKYLVYYAKNHFLDELSEFLIVWGHDHFYGNEIEDVGNVSINFGHLEDEQG